MKRAIYIGKPKIANVSVLPIGHVETIECEVRIDFGFTGDAYLENKQWEFRPDRDEATTTFKVHRQDLFFD